VKFASREEMILQRSGLKIEGPCGRVQKFEGKRIKNQRKRKIPWPR
jgi:hypothetical protein